MKKKQTIRLNEEQLNRVVAESVKRALECLNEYEDWKAQMLNAPEHMANDENFGGKVNKAEEMFGKKYGFKTKQDSDVDWKNNFPEKYAQLDRYGGYVSTKGRNGFNTTSVHNASGVRQSGDVPDSQENVDLHNNVKNDMEDFYSGNYKRRLQQKKNMLGNANSGQDFTPSALKVSEAVNRAIRKYLR